LSSQTNISTRQKVATFAGIVCLTGAIVGGGIGLYLNHSVRGALRKYTTRPVEVMGTECLLTAVAGSREQAREAFEAAERELRRVEVLMSVRLRDSQLSRLNCAEPGKFVPLSDELLAVLNDAKQLAAQTDGAFDVTVGPLITLWRQAGRTDKAPSPRQITQVRAQCGWEGFELLAGGAKRLRAGATIDLGGIAKGYGIDRAVEAMRRTGAAGGLVDVGGDIRCFGTPPDRRAWRIGVRNPFHPSGDKMLMILNVAEGAVCTSGNYFRYCTIGGRRYSHIIDPRSGRPTEAAASVTVWAPTATVADAWATALSVLGPDGLSLLGTDGRIEAMLVVGTEQDHRIVKTDGFDKLLAR